MRYSKDFLRSSDVAEKNTTYFIVSYSVKRENKSLGGFMSITPSNAVQSYFVQYRVVHNTAEHFISILHTVYST